MTLPSTPTPPTLIKHSWPAALPDDANHVRKYDLVIADPPYNQGVIYDSDPYSDRMTDHQYVQWTRDTIMMLSRYVAADGIFAYIVPPRFGHLVWSALLANNMWLYNSCPVVMHETFSQYQESQMTVDYRLIFLAYNRFGNGDRRINDNLPREQSKRQEVGDKRANPDGRVPGMVWNVRRLQGTSVDRVPWHPCQLAPELYARLTSLVGDGVGGGVAIMDAFSGSGTLATAAPNSKLNPRLVLVDQSAKYLKETSERWARANSPS